jgi:hypothetical protein
LINKQNLQNNLDLDWTLQNGIPVIGSTLNGPGQLNI